VGAGVIGLTTALSLLRRGIRVTVIADRYAPDLTSVVAGALWEWPPAVCGYHQDQVSLSRSKAWCVVSYRMFAELAREPETGVFMRPAVFYFHQSVSSNHREASKMEELRRHVLGFRHDASLISEFGVNRDFGVVDAYMHLAPMIDTDAYMPWLRREVERLGCTFLKRRIALGLEECAAALRAEFRAGLIVNCSGLGAKELGDASVYPLRGALVRVLNNSLTTPIEAAHCVAHNEASNSQDIVFIVPRGRDLVVLGGLAEPHEWSKDISLENYEPIRRMYQRCVEFLPQLRFASIDASEPVRVGLRPVRQQNVRLELDPKLSVIHSYGHGGSGVTLSWGCAEEAASLVEGFEGRGRAVEQPEQFATLPFGD
jgi:D-amino-acid oxidase